MHIKQTNPPHTTPSAQGHHFENRISIHHTNKSGLFNMTANLQKNISHGLLGIQQPRPAGQKPNWN